MAVTVDELLSKSFSERTLEEKLQIVMTGKPRPILNWKITCRKGKKIFYKPWSDIYNQIKCLTTSESRKQIFCWPCLLFMDPSKYHLQPRSFEYDDVLEAMKIHEETAQHMKAVFKLKLFTMENVKADFVENPLQHNSEVKRNRDILKHVIDAVCFAAKKWKRNLQKYEPNMLEVSDCINFLQLVQHCDISNRDVVDDAIRLLNRSPEVVNTAVDAITVALKITIANEAQDSTYISLILSEHVIHQQKSQVSTVLRFIKNGEVCERFVGFTNLVGQKWNAYFAGNHILNVKKGYEVKGKFLALSVDGAVLPRKELLHLMKLPNWYQCTYFAPCHFQGIGRVLMQSVYNIEECSLFFKIVSEIECYFENEQSFKAFENQLCAKFPHLKDYNWYAKSPFLVILSMHRKHFLAYFDSVLTNPKCTSAEDLVKLTTFKKYFEKFKSVFLLRVFSKIFGEDFDQNLNFYPPVNLGCGRFDKFRLLLVRIHRTGFQQIWIDTSMEMLFAEAPDSVKELAMSNPVKNELHDLFKLIINSMIQDLDLIYTDKDKLRFCDLMTSQTGGVLSFKQMHADAITTELTAEIDKVTFFNELHVLEADSSSILACRSVHELLETFIEYNLQDVFSELFTLVKLVLTLPILPARPGDGKETLKLKQINKYSYIPQATGIPSGEISVICIEDHLLQDLKCSKSFYDKVIVKFGEINKHMKLEPV